MKIIVTFPEDIINLPPNIPGADVLGILGIWLKVTTKMILKFPNDILNLPPNIPCISRYTRNMTKNKHENDCEISWGHYKPAF